MSTTFLVFILAFGLIMPLFWIIGTIAAVGCFCVYKGKDMIVSYQENKASAGATSNGQTVIAHPQLGLTMADGGDSIEKKDKE